jgi:hypothetical protein
VRRSALIAVALAAITAPAAGADTWTAPTTLSSDGGFLPAVEVARGGDAVVTWTQGGGAWMSQRAAGDVFAAPERLGDGGWPAAAIDDTGDAVVAWTGADGGVYATLREGHGPFGQPRLISDPQRSGYREPLRLDAAMNAHGDVVVVWFEPPVDWDTANRFNTRRVMAVTRPAHADFSAPQEIATYDSTAGFPGAALDDAGRATLAWHADRRVWVAGGDVRSGFGGAQLAGGYAEAVVDNFALASTPAGAVTLIGTVGPIGPSGSPLPPGVYVTTKEPGGEFGAFRSIAQAGPPFFGAMAPRLTLTADGAGAVAWWGGGGSGFNIKRPGADWQPPQLVYTAPGSDQVRDPAVGIDSHGQTVVAMALERGWSRREPITVVRRLSNGRMERPVTLGAPGTRNIGPALAFDGLGNGVLVWEGSDADPGERSGYDTSQPVKLALYDGKPPQIAAFSLAAKRRSFRVKLSEPARVTVTIRRAKRRVGRLHARLARGTRLIPIPRRVRAKLRKHGSYTASMTARDSAGKRTVRRIRFSR